MTLLFPVFNRQTGSIYITEVDFFINSNQITTVHANDLWPLKEIFKKYKDDPKALQKLINDNPGTLVYEILSRLLQHLFPMLTNISKDIDSIEKVIFSGQEKRMIKDILMAKRNIVNFRRSMQSHKNVITKLIEKGPQFFSCARLNIYFKNLVANTKDIWDLLETYKETITNLEDTNNSLVSSRLNYIMKTLTIFSVIVFPLSLFAAIFGMNTIISMPFVEHPQGFWIVVSMMAIGILLMLIVFKKKKWL